MVDEANSGHGEVEVAFALSLEQGSMRVVLPVPERDVSLTELLPILQQFTNGVTQRMAAVTAERGEPVQCGPQCGSCCRQIVPISPFEAQMLAQWIRSLQVEQQEALAIRFQRALVQLQEAGVLAKLTPEIFAMSPEHMRSLATEYFATGVACPFLVEESCSIHPIRPLVCREYMVVSPPEFCATPGHAQVHGVVLPVRPSRALMKLGKRVEGDAQGWLPLVFLISWMGAGIKPGDAVRGPGPEVLREFVNAL